MSMTYVHGAIVRLTMTRVFIVVDCSAAEHVPFRMAAFHGVPFSPDLHLEGIAETPIGDTAHSAIADFARKQYSAVESDARLAFIIDDNLGDVAQYLGEYLQHEFPKALFAKQHMSTRFGVRVTRSLLDDGWRLLRPVPHVPFAYRDVLSVGAAIVTDSLPYSVVFP